MSAIQDTELDAQVRAAFEALEATVPDGYFDGFEARLHARLEQEIMTENSNQIDTDAELGTAAGESMSAPASADSDLSEIRSLAARTKESVSQRVLALESPADEPLISSITLALKTISLPQPGKDSKIFAAGESAKVSTAVAARDDEGRLPTWIWAAISAALAAAIVFFLVRGDKREDATQVASSEPPSGSIMNGSQAYPDTARTPRTIANDSRDTSSGALHALPPGTIGSTDGATDNDGSDGEGGAPAASGAARADVAPKTNARPTTDSMPATAKTTRSISKSARSRAGTRTSAIEESKAAAPDGKPPVEDKASSQPKKKADTLEDLLAEASAKPKDGDSATAGATQEPKKPSRTELDGNDVKKAMKPIEGKARECYKQFQQPGLVMIKFGVDPSGKVTSAAATGKFKNTDTGKCVASVVKEATFPAYNGPPSSFSYAFLLSQ